MNEDLGGTVSEGVGECEDVSMDERSMKYTHARWAVLAVTHPHPQEIAKIGPA